MFSNAVMKMAGYTLPLIICKRKLSRKTECSSGSAILLNSSGWTVCAYHVIKDYFSYRESIGDTRGYLERLRRIEDRKTSDFIKRREIILLERDYDRNLIMDFGMSIGGLEAEIEEIIVNKGADLALVRFKGLPVLDRDAYPEIKDPGSDFLPGTSLCRYGFPFNNIDVKFNKSAGRFDFCGEGLAGFPNEGMMTRIIRKTYDKVAFEFIETSSPGLKGQSGGPLADSNGIVWGVQSHTVHYNLDFNVYELNRDGQRHKVPQFLNAGLASHSRYLAEMLVRNGIRYREGN